MSDPVSNAIADALVERLRPLLERHAAPAAPLSWRERLWVAPAETRLNVADAAEALGRPRSWIYRRTSVRALARAERLPLPHRKLDGELVFLAGELRNWLKGMEAVVQADPTP